MCVPRNTRLGRDKATPSSYLQMTRSLIETPPIVNTVARRVSLNTPMPQSLFFSAKQILVNSECGQKREPSVNVLTRWPDHSIQWIELNWTGCPCCTKYWISSLTSEGNGISTTAPHQLGQSRESHEAATENEDRSITRFFDISCELVTRLLSRVRTLVMTLKQ